MEPQGEEERFSDVLDCGTMENVSDWVRRSVLFWNTPDSISIDDGQDRKERESSRSPSSICDQEKDLKSSIETASDKVGLKPSSWEIFHESSAEPANFFTTDKEESTGDMMLDVESIQKLLIEPFIMEQRADNKTESCDSLSNDSPYYTLSFPKYTKHIYSPLYEEHSGLTKENCNPVLAQRPDWNIADTLNRIGYTWGQVESSSLDGEKCQKANGECENEYGRNISEDMETKRASVDSDVLRAIKRVQETLGEIAEELHTTRTRKTSKDRDPNVILVNLLSRIQPPANRDSFTCSPTNDAPETSQKDKMMAEDIVEGSAVSPVQIEPMTAALDKNEGDEEDFDVLKDLSDSGKTTEEVLQELMEKISTMSKPSSALRGFLKRISEEVTSDNSIEQSLNQSFPADDDENEGEGNNNTVVDPKKVGLNDACMIVVEQEGNTECNIQQSEVIAKDADNCQTERRISSISAVSSFPTSPSATNYDSGFSELTKNLTYTRKENLASFASDDMRKENMERRFKEAFAKCSTGFDSETSTDWSPCSTLSHTEKAFPPKSALKQSPFQRVSPRRRSTGATTSKPQSRMQPGNTHSCPNFDRSNLNPLQDSYNRYTRSEVEAIRKFLSLTSLYFGSNGNAKDLPNSTYDELIKRGDIEIIHTIIQRQRDDLERQRRKQDDLYAHLGDLLLQLVSLKEEHLSSTQKQTKALVLLKKQLDIQKKEQSRAQETIKEQLKTLGEQFSSSMTLDLPPQGHLSQKDRQTPIPRSPTNKHTGQIIWKITGITRKVTRIHAGASDNVSVSEPFYSSSYGYKMAAWVYLNGRADFRGKGISVYVCPLCGEYDAILPWPVRPVYTFTLIDQNPDPELRRNHTKVRNVVEISKKGDTALSNKGGIPRPQHGRKSFIIGFDDFISQAELASSKYILDDTMFLKVEAQIIN